MASTAHKTAAEYVEHFDDEATLESKITQLADWLRTSKHSMAFTGAGISTSTGIPDFRSGMNTVLKTGAGAWTLRAEEQKAGKSLQRADVKHVSTLKAIPSLSHMSLVALNNAGLLPYLVSQNTDGLHRRSGFPTKSLAELHGNSNLEVCSNKSCGKEYLRDFHTRNNQHVHKHETGRSCKKCGSMLLDTIINFGESLPEKDLTNGFAWARKSELCLALGSSLRVTPAADIPAGVRGKLVIVNLQATPLDEHADLRINATIDTVFERLMKKLNLEIPSFTLTRRVSIKQTEESTGSTITVQGLDVDGTDLSLFRSVRLNGVERNTEPLSFFLPGQGSKKGLSTSASSGLMTLKVELQPMGHYREPVVELSVPVQPNSTSVWTLIYDPVHTGQWIHVINESEPREKEGEKKQQIGAASSSSSSGATQKNKVQSESPTQQLQSLKI